MAKQARLIKAEEIPEYRKLQRRRKLVLSKKSEGGALKEIQKEVEKRSGSSSGEEAQVARKAFQNLFE